VVAGQCASCSGKETNCGPYKVRSGSRLCENASLDLILGIRFSRDLREDQMKRFVEGSDRGQSTLFPECVADWIGEDNPVRVIEVFDVKYAESAKTNLWPLWRKSG
jgi:hypothetical protein